MYAKRMKIENAGRKKTRSNGSLEIILPMKLPGTFLNPLILLVAIKLWANATETVADVQRMSAIGTFSTPIEVGI